MESIRVFEAVNWKASVSYNEVEVRDLRLQATRGVLMFIQQHHNAKVAGSTLYANKVKMKNQRYGKVGTKHMIVLSEKQGNVRSDLYSDPKEQKRRQRSILFSTSYITATSNLSSAMAEGSTYQYVVNVRAMSGWTN